MGLRPTPPPAFIRVMNDLAHLVKLTVSITILLFGASLSPVVAAHVRYDFFPEGHRSFPASLVFEGEIIQQPKVIERAPLGKSDQSSPEAVAASMLKAAFDGDTNAYNSLYIAAEQSSSLADGSKGESVQLAATAKLYFGGFTILVCEVKSSGGAGQYPMVFQKVGEKFFLTDVLSNTNTAYELFRNSLSAQKTVSVANKSSASSNVIEETVFAPNKPQLPPAVKVQLEGRDFAPPLPCTNIVTASTQNLRTPEGTLTAIYNAVKAADAEWYLSLVAPDERDSASDLGVPLRTMLKDKLPQLSRNLQSPRKLSRAVRYGNYTILLFRTTDASSRPDWLVLKQSGSEWLLSDKLRGGDPVLNYLLGEIETHSYAYQKVLPTP